MSTRRLLISIVSVFATLSASGCCLGDFSSGVSSGFNRGMECELLITAVNAAETEILAMPEPMAGINVPTPEQAETSMEPLAATFDRHAASYRAITITTPELAAQRDALAVLYGEMSAHLRQQQFALALAMRTGDDAALDRIANEPDVYTPREDAITASINGICGR